MLSLILPTFNESQNLPPLLEELAAALRGIDYEVIVVDDDSPDRTWEAAERLRDRYPFLKVIRRVGRRGLSSAVADGMRAAGGDVLAVMDADGQHDPKLLLAMLEEIDQDRADLVIGSRYMPGGSVGNWHLGRRLLSATGTLVTRLGLSHAVRDPLSGLFAIRRSQAMPVVDAFEPEGFKILLDLLVRLPRTARVRELPFVFRTRLSGESKLTLSVHLAVLRTIIPIILARYGRRVFIILCITLGLLLLSRAWPLRALYLDADVRSRVKAELQAVADRHGWLLSDLSVRSVTAEEMQVIRRAHGRGADPEVCLRVRFADSSILPCGA